MRSKRSLRVSGFTYVEALAAIAMTALLMVGLLRTLTTVFDARDAARTALEAQEESRYALERVVRAVSASQRLLIPQAENPGTAHLESLRDPGFLAITLDPSRDVDADGWPDADNDRDGRIDEDVGNDAQNDFGGGIYQVDDDNDGITDPIFSDWSDDESGFVNEDRINGSDDDGDGAVDEDPAGDMNGDGAPGISGIDDDGDGSTDEGSVSDDDEDGVSDEDWWDVHLFYLAGSDLMERVAVPWDETGAGGITGRDFVVNTLASDVVQFSVERIEAPNGGPPLVSILLTRNDANGNPITFEVTTLLGGGP